MLSPLPCSPVSREWLRKITQIEKKKKHGYVPVPSTIDHEHRRGLMKSTIAPDMSVELENTFTAVSQKVFFSNSPNKQKFMDLLTVHSEADHHAIVKWRGYYIFHY